MNFLVFLLIEKPSLQIKKKARIFWVYTEENLEVWSLSDVISDLERLKDSQVSTLSALADLTSVFGWRNLI